MPYHLDQGLDPGFWFELDAPEQFVARALAAAEQHPADSYVSITDLNRDPVRHMAHGKTGPAIRMLDHRLAAHALTARAVAKVELTTRPVSFYELEALLWDLLAAPAAGIDRSSLHDWLVERRRDHNRRRPARTAPRKILRKLVSDAIPLEQAFPRAQGAIFG